MSRWGIQKAWTTNKSAHAIIPLLPAIVKEEGNTKPPKSFNNCQLQHHTFNPQGINCKSPEPKLGGSWVANTLLPHDTAPENHPHIAKEK